MPREVLVEVVDQVEPGVAARSARAHEAPAHRSGLQEGRIPGQVSGQAVIALGPDPGPVAPVLHSHHHPEALFLNQVPELTFIAPGPIIPFLDQAFLHHILDQTLGLAVIGMHPSGNAQYNTNFRQNVFHTTTTTTMFSYSPLTHTHVIISPVTPLYFGSYHYYWGGHYVHTPERPQQCEYTITDDDQELRNVTFSNGTKPTTLTFGCKSSESCCGLECCTSSSTWITIIVIIVGIVLLIVACSWCNKKGYCQNETVVTTGIPVIATTTTTTHSYTTQGPPPPPGFQQFGPPPSAPIYSNPPAYNNYEQNSPYGGRPISCGQIHTTYKQ